MQVSGSRPSGLCRLVHPFRARLGTLLGHWRTGVRQRCQRSCSTTGAPVLVFGVRRSVYERPHTVSDVIPSVYEHNETRAEVRTTLVDGEPWFVPGDGRPCMQWPARLRQPLPSRARRGRRPGQRPAKQPGTALAPGNWFNPSIAHQCLCSSKAFFLVVVPPAWKISGRSTRQRHLVGLEDVDHLFR